MGSEYGTGAIDCIYVVVDAWICRVDNPNYVDCYIVRSIIYTIIVATLYIPSY